MNLLFYLEVGFNNSNLINMSMVVCFQVRSMHGFIDFDWNWDEGEFGFW